MLRWFKLLLALLTVAVAVPQFPTAVIAHEEPPHYRRAPVRRARTRRPPPHVRRRRVVVRHRAVTPAPAPVPAPRRPRQPIDDPRTSVYLGFGALGTVVFETDSELSRLIDTGGGLELFLGFRFNKLAALELGGMFSFHGTADPRAEVNDGILSGFTGDIKIFVLPSSRRIEPFVQLGAGLYLFSRAGWEGNELTGGGFQLGGGADIRLNRTFAIGARILYRGIFLDNSEARYWTGELYESAFLSNLTFAANLQIHF